ncbi:uncharacterized protein LOC106167589 [Lingula anatina]|uniref:Uncharacterized protein LOC106167589 n=1 Tax=Lingula anatina TaxID=7574 RepID=A0A1S3IV73_LINAN|nr:uncharacterized protein LOC106167589 [Lingula anatina]|eukprot:XP_013401846.1 uncharacterized protein LOC106167589 [Lingula anatina]
MSSIHSGNKNGHGYHTNQHGSNQHGYYPSNSGDEDNGDSSDGYRKVYGSPNRDGAGDQYYYRNHGYWDTGYGEGDSSSDGGGGGGGGRKSVGSTAETESQQEQELQQHADLKHLQQKEKTHTAQHAQMYDYTQGQSNEDTLTDLGLSKHKPQSESEGEVGKSIIVDVAPTEPPPMSTAPATTEPALARNEHIDLSQLSGDASEEAPSKYPPPVHDVTPVHDIPYAHQYPSAHEIPPTHEDPPARIPQHHKVGGKKGQSGETRQESKSQESEGKHASDGFYPQQNNRPSEDPNSRYHHVKPPVGHSSGSKSTPHDNRAPADKIVLYPEADQYYLDRDRNKDSDQPTRQGSYHNYNGYRDYGLFDSDYPYRSRYDNRYDGRYGPVKEDNRNDEGYGSYGREQQGNHQKYKGKNTYDEKLYNNYGRYGKVNSDVSDSYVDPNDAALENYKVHGTGFDYDYGGSHDKQTNAGKDIWEHKGLGDSGYFRNSLFNDHAKPVYQFPYRTWLEEENAGKEEKEPTPTPEPKKENKVEDAKEEKVKDDKEDTGPTEMPQRVVNDGDSKEQETPAVTVPTSPSPATSEEVKPGDESSSKQPATEHQPDQPSNQVITPNSSVDLLNQVTEEEEQAASSRQGPILALSLGLTVMALLLLFVGCKYRNMKRKLRRGKPLNSNEADYLINGMYL